MIEINRKYLYVFNQKILNPEQIKLESGIIIYTLSNGIELTINIYKQIFNVEPLEYYKIGYQLIDIGIYNLIVYLYIDERINCIPDVQRNVYPLFQINTKHFCDKLMQNETELNKNINIKINNNVVIEPYPHQLSNVNWMMNIEKNTDKLIIFKDPYETNNFNNQYYFNIKHKLSIYKSRPSNLGYNFYGGLLADEVGLGKTLSCILLCSQDLKYKCDWCKINNVNKTMDGKCWYSLRNGPKRGYRCNKNTNNYYCNSHKNKKNIIDYKLPIKYSPSTLDLINIRDSPYRLKSHANLILCPGHLCQQWYEEINKYYLESNKIIIKIIINKTDFNLLKPRDLMCSDYIIVNYSVICSSWYKLINNLNPIRDIYSFLNNFYPILHTFKWNRIFLDECQDIKEPIHWHIINKLCSNYRWCISGTPFNNWDNLLYIINFITNRNTRTIESDEILIYFKNNLFRRHTENQIKIKSNLIEINKFLEFTNTEQSIYNNIKQSGKTLGLSPKQILLNLRQFCCHPLASTFNDKIVKINIQTIDQIHSTITEFQKIQLNDINQSIDKFNLINNLNTDQKRQLTNLIKQKNTLSTGLDYLEKALKDNNNQDECPICLDFTDKNNQGITKCGHRFCYNPCLIRSYQESTKCPLCNQRLGPDSFYKMVDEVDNNSQLMEYISKFGTKCGQLIYDLKDILNKSNSVVIFSQQNRVLKQLDITLTQICNINTVWCKGTSQSRIKSIHKFNNDPNYNVIMLSSKHTACGTNLIKANYIIFIDPIYDSLEQRLLIETQAIGRSSRIGQNKNVQIIRYFIKNTIEEKAYNNFYKNNKLFNSNDYYNSNKIVITDE